jgi:hypothetical protein
MDIFSRLDDVNVFVLRVPTQLDRNLVVATLHPFNLDGHGYEARIYMLRPDRVELSAAALGAGTSAWGLDELSVNEDGSIEASRDNEFSLRIWASLPCTVRVGWKYFETHPELPDDRAPSEILELLDKNDCIWEEQFVTECPRPTSRWPSN